MDDFVWLRHPLTGGVASFAPGAAEIWIQRGWEPCDPPDDETPTPAPATELDAVPESTPASRRQPKEK